MRTFAALRHESLSIDTVASGIYESKIGYDLFLLFSDSTNHDATGRSADIGAQPCTTDGDTIDTDLSSESLVTTTCIIRKKYLHLLKRLTTFNILHDNDMLVKV